MPEINKENVEALIQEIGQIIRLRVGQEPRYVEGSNLAPTLSRELVRARQARGISQIGLSRMLDVAPNTMSRLENLKDDSPVDLGLLAKAFRVLNKNLSIEVQDGC